MFVSPAWHATTLAAARATGERPVAITRAGRMIAFVGTTRANIVDRDIRVARRLPVRWLHTNTQWPEKTLLCVASARQPVQPDLEALRSSVSLPVGLLAF